MARALLDQHVLADRLKALDAQMARLDLAVARVEIAERRLIDFRVNRRAAASPDTGDE